MCRPRTSILLVVLLLAAAAVVPRAFAAQQDVPDTTGVRPDSLVGEGDSLAVGEADTAAARIPEIVILSDSLRALLDSAAVAALDDTVTTPEPERSSATPVEFFGRNIFNVFSGLGSYDAATRSQRLTRRLESVATSQLSLDSLRIVEGTQFTTLQLGRQIIMTVTEEDAAGLSMVRREAAIHYAQRIQEETERVREQSTLRSILIRVGIAILLVFALLLALKGLGRLFGWIDQRVEIIGRAWVRPLVIGKVEVVSRDRIVQGGQTMVQLTRILTSIFLVYIFLTTVFGLFPRTRSWSRLLLGYLVSPIQALGRSLVEALPNLLAIIVIIIIIRWAIKLSNFLFQQIAEGHVTLPGFYPEFAEPTRKIVRFLLVVLAVLLIYPYTPIADSRVFQGLTIFLGVLFSLGSSSAVSNVIAGIVLTYTRSFQIGDRIRVTDIIGDVVEKTFLVTRVRTPKNEDVAIPNSAMLSNQITNYTSMTRSGTGVSLYTRLTIGYDVPWPQVHRILINAAERTTDVMAEPAPFVLQTSLGDFAVEYELNAYTMAPQRMSQLYSDLHQNIQDTFAEAGVEILSPVYEAQRDGSASTVPRLGNQSADTAGESSAGSTS